MTAHCIIDGLEYDVREMYPFKDGWVSEDGLIEYAVKRIAEDEDAVKAYIEENKEDYLLDYYGTIVSNEQMLETMIHGYSGDLERERDYCECGGYAYFIEFLERYDRGKSDGELFHCLIQH